MSDHPLLPQLERIEREAWADLAAAAPEPFARAVGLEAAPVHHAFFFCCARIPVFQFNWLSGAGLNGDNGSAILEAVHRFRAAGVKKAFIQIPPGPNAAHCADVAYRQGLVEHPLAWAKFHRKTANAPAVATDLNIREATAATRDAFASTVLAGFGMPDAMAVWLGALVGRPKWKTYVSYDGDKPAGAGALYVDGDFAWLGIGATRPEMRKRGGQSALLARRLSDAAAIGAKHATTETGVPQGNAPAPSYANIRKAGFDVAYVRPNWTFAEAL